jgi:Fic family protein
MAHEVELPACSFERASGKVIARIRPKGVDGFEGGLSAENYIGIMRTSRATATRDLQHLVEKGALTRSGGLCHTRYALNLPNTDM